MAVNHWVVGSSPTGGAYAKQRSLNAALLLIDMKKYFTYILQSKSTGKYYIGNTHDIDQRLRQHNEHTFTGSLSTKRLSGPWILVYTESFNTRSEAVRREKEFKAWKSSKAIERFLQSPIFL